MNSRNPIYIRRIPVLFLALLLVTGSLYAGPRVHRSLTALDRYVFKPDPNYHYTLVNTAKGEGCTTYVLDMTSQQWRSAADVDHPIWRHWLVIVLPDQVQTSIGFLFINGGSITSKAPVLTDPGLAAMAVRTHSVVADLRGVPNEPLTFKDETRSRNEDAIIAYSWVKFLKTGDETWPLRLPMTKSAVRAMDTVTDFCGSRERGNVKVDRFVVAGGSKRGWTTWTTAAVDDRVIAILPFVIDVLNNEKSMEHQFRSYGFWAPAIGDYTEAHIQDWSGTRQYKALMIIEDPYSYRDRLTMPKLIVNSAGDQYFLPDSWQFYFEDLKGEKYLRYVPNTKHSLGNSDARESLQAFYESILVGSPRPRFSWKFEKDGSILVHTQEKPAEVKLWQATNPKARDFRLDTIGPAYKSTVLAPDRDGIYTGQVSRPPEGWTAYFIELTYPSGGKYPFKFTTGVRVIPDTLPFPAPGKATANQH
ncbi:MAG TPA: PhoPQ-activated pathogenicity-related family protein [Acidobacteriota bacterium]